MTKLNKRSIEKCENLPKWGLHFLEMVSNIKKGAITIITPDGTGVTMMFVAGPMIGLYFAGMLLIERKQREKLNT